jgi:[ribosomal protein S5]-alanine N-acetyltransferase
MTPPERPAAIETARLRLVALLPDEIRALIGGDTDRASESIDAMFPPGWPEGNDAREGLPWHLRHLEIDARHRAWRIRVIVERTTNTVVGSVNLKGPPDADGDVEIGWGITADRRGIGYAFEAAAAVIAWALAQPGTSSISATIPEDNVASARLAAKLGLSRTTLSRRGLPLWSLRP